MSCRISCKNENGCRLNYPSLKKKYLVVVKGYSLEGIKKYSKMGKDQELLDAARNGNLSIVEKIISQRAKRSGPLASLRRGPGANVQDNSGYTPLHHAALNGHKDVVSLLLTHDASTNIVDNKGSSPLHLAAWTGNTEIVNMILTQGVLPTNVNLANHDRETPLHSAAQYGHTEVVSLLLQHSADPTIRNLKDETPLDLAAQYGRLETVELLVRTHPELLLGGSAAVRTHSPLHLASRNGHRQVVQVLLRSGLDVNIHTDGGSALHEAALFGKVDVVRVLLEHGIDLESEDSRHRTVLDILDDLKTHISQEIAAIIKNHSTLINTDDMENANSPHPYSNKYSSIHSSSRVNQDDTSSPYYNCSSVIGNALSPNDRGNIQRVPKGRPGENDQHTPGGCADNYQMPPPPRSLESSMEDSDLSMASSLYQTPPPPRELDDAMSIGSYYDTPSSSATSRDGFQRTSLPLENESSNVLYQVPPPPREALKRMSDPVDAKTREQEPRMDRTMVYSAGATSYIPMAPVQVMNKGSLKPPQKPPRKNMSPHSPTKFQPGMPDAYEFLCLASSGGCGPNSEYDCNTSGYSSLNKDSYVYRYYNDPSNPSNEYVDMKMRHSFASPYENNYPNYTNSWDPSKVPPGDRRTFCFANEDGVVSPTDSTGSPYENVTVVDRKVLIGDNAIYASVNKLKSGNGGGEGFQPLPSNHSERPVKPNSLNIQGRKTGPSDGEEQPLSPTGYDQPPTPDFPPPSPGTAESGIHEKIRPLSQEYKCKRRSRDIDTLTEDEFFQALEGKESKSVSTENIEEATNDKPFADLYRGSLTLPSPTFTSSEDTCDETTTMASTGTSDSEQQSTTSTLTSDRPRRHHPHYRSTANSNHYENVIVLSNGLPGDHPERRVHLSSSSASPTYENVVLRPSSERHTNSSGQDRKDVSLSILSPFDENEEWAKIADIMASFGGGIGSSLDPSSSLLSSGESLYFAKEIEEEYLSRKMAGHVARLDLSPVGLWLARQGVPEYETLLLSNGFDDLDFMGDNMLDDQELFEIGIMNAEHRNRIVTAAKNLPAVTSLSSLSPTKLAELTVDSWLDSLHLGQYKETFQKHRYTDLDRVARMWEVELTTVLEITRLGHKKRILTSLGERPPLPHSYENINELNSDLKQLNTEISQLGLGMTSSGNDQNIQNTLRSSKLSRKGPAPQPPPRLQSVIDSNGNKAPDEKGIDDLSVGVESLPMREPSQLFSGIPTSLTTQWRHKPEVLITNCCNYTAQYLGSTLVRELKGVETTKKSIQKLKKSTSEIVKVPNIILSISYRGVKFIDAKTMNVVCEHEIRNIHCACQDADDLNHFAYITKDHQSENHYCHVFSVATMDLATEVILTLGQAFEVAYQLALRDRNRITSSPAPGRTTSTPTPLSPSAPAATANAPAAGKPVLENGVIRPTTAEKRRLATSTPATCHTREAVSPVTPTAKSPIPNLPSPDMRPAVIS